MEVVLKIFAMCVVFTDQHNEWDVTFTPGTVLISGGEFTMVKETNSRIYPKLFHDDLQDLYDVVTKEEYFAIAVN